jgi:hypothetical protein
MASHPVKMQNIKHNLRGLAALQPRIAAICQIVVLDVVHWS